MANNEWLRLRVVSTGAEYLAMGYLMRRNILTYKAPEGNEGYDLICIHPGPRYKPNKNEKTQIRAQVKSKYQADCDGGFPIKKKSIDAFVFFIIVFMNIGKFYGKNDGTTVQCEPEFYTLTSEFIKKHHDSSSTWQKVKLKSIQNNIEPFKNEKEFELIAKTLLNVLHSDHSDHDVESISIILICHLMIENRINKLPYDWLTDSMPYMALMEITMLFYITKVLENKLKTI